MKIIKKIIGHVLIIYTMIGCSTLSIDEIITPSTRAMQQQSQETLNKTFEEYFYEEEDEDYKRIAKEDVEYRIERTEFIKRKVLDSIGINHKSLIIIDLSGHNFSGKFEDTYFFYDENVLRAYQREFSLEFNPTILKIEKLEPIQHRGLIALFNHFNKENHREINTTIDFNPEILQFGSFYITVILNKKVKLYYANKVDLMNSNKLEIFE